MKILKMLGILAQVNEILTNGIGISPTGVIILPIQTNAKFNEQPKVVRNILSNPC